MDYEKIAEILARLFVDGDSHALLPLLADNCEYISEPADRTLSGAEEIISVNKDIHDKIIKCEEDLRYTCDITEISPLLKDGVDISDLKAPDGTIISPYGLIMRQNNQNKISSIAYFALNEQGKIQYIRLSHDRHRFKPDFYYKDLDFDSPRDLPDTVKPYTTHDRQVEEMVALWRGQNSTKRTTNCAGDVGDNAYVWRKADEYAKEWLPHRGYRILLSEILDDCIAYLCLRDNLPYTIFMYAYGKNKKANLNGETCVKLNDMRFTQDSIALVFGVNVHRFREGDDIKFKVRDYYGNDNQPDLWHPTEAQGKPILEYYPSKEMMDGKWQFMYAFNHEDTDIYDCIIADIPTIEGEPDKPGVFWNQAFYERLLDMHKKYGDMKMGYVTYNNTVYYQLPYLDGLGFFSWSIDRNNGRMFDFKVHPFDKNDYKEFIKTQQREPDDLFDFIPKLYDAQPLKPQPTERFAAKLYFDNGECKKFVLPINKKYEHDEAVQYNNYVFSDGIWNSIAVAQTHKSRYYKEWHALNYPDGGSAITFKNGYYIAAPRSYLESEPYTEPVLTDEIIFEDDKLRVRKIWEWKANSIWQDKETNLLGAILSGSSRNIDGKSTFCSVGGIRETSLVFDNIGDFHEGLAYVLIDGPGYGYIDKNMNLVIPLKYDCAEDFKDGLAKVYKDGEWFFIDKTGREIKLKNALGENNYEVIGDFHEGMCKVSTLQLDRLNLAYYSEFWDIAGCWGFIDENGKEVIPPQFIYAYDFEDGFAVCAKGEWTIDPKWDNKYNQGCYWREEELWGAIDKEGNEVIPFIFDEIKFFNDRTDVLKAHVGGWENGMWGLIDNRGNWLTEPIFEYIDYEYYDGLFAFSYGDYEGYPNDAKLGIYDVKQGKVLFEPQFEDVYFLNNGCIEVEVYNEILKKNIAKILDRDGKERIIQFYSSIYECDGYCIVTKKGDFNGKNDGITDKEGNVIVPCKYDISYSRIFPNDKKFIFRENGKLGVMDFDENVVIPPLYLAICKLTESLFYVYRDKGNVGILTTDGKTVLPIEYEKISMCNDNRHLYACRQNSCCMFVLEEVANGS